MLAARLTEDPDVSVALLEAGGEDSQPEIHVPAAFPALFKSSFDWDLLGEPEPGLDGRRLYLPRGRMLGGCSSINAMIYIRGNRADYDGWAAAGCEGWSYDEVLPYFRRSEDNERGEDAVSRRRRSDGGLRQPLDAPARRHDARGRARRRPRAQPRLQRRPPGGRRPLPADPARRPAVQHRRRVPAPGAERQNLTRDDRARWRCGSCSTATRAVGVEIARDGQVEFVGAEREVILAAGTYQSPVLLMLSGIGPEDQLAPFGIEMRSDLPVGHDLQDHCMAQVNYLTDEPSLFGVSDAGEHRAARARAAAR